MGFLRGFSIAMGANLILFVLSFLNNKLIYITLGIEENGLYLLIMRFSLLVTLVFGEWLRLTNMNVAGRDKSLNPVLSANVIAYSGLIGIILVFSALYSPSLLASIFLGLPSKYIFPVIIIGLCLIVRNCFQSLLLVNNHMYRYGTTYVLWGSIFLILDFFFLVIFDLGLIYVVYALFIASALAALWAFVSSYLSNGFSLKPSLKVFGMSGKMGIRSAFAVLGMFLMINVHIFGIKPLVGKNGEGLVMVGIFSVCFRVFQLFQRCSDVTGNILYSNVAQNEEKSGYKMTMLVCRNLIFFSLLFAVIGGLLGKYLILIISDSKFLDAYVPLLFMLPGIVFMNTGTVLNSSYWGRGYPFKVIIAPYFAAVVGLAMDIVLIPEIGASGAALSFSGMSLLWFIYVVEVFRRDSGFYLREIILPNYSDFVYIISRIRNKQLKVEM